MTRWGINLARIIVFFTVFDKTENVSAQRFHFNMGGGHGGSFGGGFGGGGFDGGGFGGGGFR